MPNKHWLIAIIIMFLSILIPYYVFGADWIECLNGSCTGELELSLYPEEDSASSDTEYNSTITWVISKITFEPKEDITVYELALAVKCFIDNNNYCDSPPKEIERHFNDKVICTGPKECREMGY